MQMLKTNMMLFRKIKPHSETVQAVMTYLKEPMYVDDIQLVGFVFGYIFVAFGGGFFWGLVLQGVQQ